MSKYDIPLFEDREEIDTYINQCYEDQIPALLVDMVDTREWATVEFDMLTTGEDDRHQVLTESTVEKINALAEQYEEHEEISYDNNSTLSVTYGSNYCSFPYMLPEIAQEFANAIAPIVLDERNWELDNERS